jgi:guanylate kinase
MTKLFVISAPSGTGKTSLIKSLLEDSTSKNLKLGVSCTTRKKRANEIEGVSYFFTNKTDFEEMLSRKKFLEHAEVFGNLYGTPKDWVYEQLEKGKDIVLELDWQGANQVKDAYEEAVTIFILPPSYDSLKQRLDDRNQDSETEIKNRLSQAKLEIQESKNFDQLIVNDNFNLALEDLVTLVNKRKSINLKRSNLTRNCLNQLLDQ